MRLDFFMLADAAQFSEEGKVSVLGGAVNRVMPPSLPFVLPQLAAVARVLFDDPAESRPPVSLRVSRPDRSELARLPPMQLARSQRELLEGEQPAATIIIQLQNLEFRDPGQHTFELLFGDDVLAALNVFVTLPPKPA
jgi:hypothetical protein